jgi:hypothetical protein
MYSLTVTSWENHMREELQFQRPNVRDIRLSRKLEQFRLQQLLIRKRAANRLLIEHGFGGFMVVERDGSG